MRYEQLIHTSAVLQKGPHTDGYRYIQPDSAGRRACHCYWIMSHDYLDDFHDGLKPVPTLSGFAITRRGCSGDVAVTGTGSRGALRRPRLPGCGRGPVCARLHQDRVPPSERRGRTAICPWGRAQASPLCRYGRQTAYGNSWEGPRGSSWQVTRRAVECGF